MATATASKQKTQTTKKTAKSKQSAAEEQTMYKWEPTAITAEERSQMIAEAAYYRAEKRGFDPEGQVQDWLEAESEVDAILRKFTPESAEVSD